MGDFPITLVSGLSMEKSQISQSYKRRRRRLWDFFCRRCTGSQISSDHTASAVDLRVPKQELWNLTGSSNSIACSKQCDEPCESGKSTSRLSILLDRTQPWSKHTLSERSCVGRATFWYKLKEAVGGNSAANKGPSYHVEAAQWAPRLKSAPAQHPSYSPISYTPQVKPINTSNPCIASGGVPCNHVPGLTGGAAARAAAAAQNEILESARVTTPGELLRTGSHCINDDSESGLGIDVGDSHKKDPGLKSSVYKIGTCIQTV